MSPINEARAPPDCHVSSAEPIAAAPSATPMRRSSLSRTSTAARMTTKKCLGGDQQRRVSRRRAIQPDVEEQVCQSRLQHSEQEERRLRLPRSGTLSDRERSEHDRSDADLDAEQVDGRQLLKRDLAHRRRETPRERRCGKHRDSPDLSRAQECATLRERGQMVLSSARHRGESRTRGFP
jgi:hypothetical protein